MINFRVLLFNTCPRGEIKPLQLHTNLPHNNCCPPASTLLAIAAAAVAVRVALIAAFALTSGKTVSDIATARDGEQFMAYAAALVPSGEDVDSATPTPDAYTLRLFPLTPVVYAAIHAAGVPLTWATLAVSVLGSAAACALAAALLRCAAVGWLMVAFTPNWLLCGTIPATEAVVLPLILAGLLLTRWALETDRSGGGLVTSGGGVLGLAGLARPVACFAVAGVMFAAWRRGRSGVAAVVGAVSLAVVGLGFALIFWRFGDWVTFRGYADTPQGFRDGQILTWPFRSLIMTPWVESVPVWKLAYVYAHVAFALLACVLLIRQVWRSERDAADNSRGRAVLLPAVAVWAVGTVGFASCTSDRWGFHEFPRFIVPCLPALLFAFRGWLTRKRAWLWGLLAAGSLGLGWMLLGRSF